MRTRSLVSTSLALGLAAAGCSPNASSSIANLALPTQSTANVRNAFPGDVPSSVSQAATVHKTSSSQCPCLYAAGDNSIGDSSVTIYAHGASGNVAPIQRIYGSALYFPTGIAVDPINGDIYVANSGNADVTIYPPGANGNAREIAQLNNKYGYGPAFVALDASANIYVSYGETANVIQVWAAGSTGNAAPIATIRGSKTGLNVPDQLTVDSNGNIYVANDGTPSITVYAAGKSGNIAPMETIGGRRTKLHGSGAGDTVGVAVDASDNIYASTYQNSKFLEQVNTYAAGSNGNVAPTSEIKGRKTKLGALGIAIH